VLNTMQAVAESRERWKLGSAWIISAVRSIGTAEFRKNQHQ